MEATITQTPALIHPLTYNEYTALVEQLVEQNKTTGPDQTEERIAFTRLNWQRMKRVGKQFVLLPELKAALQQLQEPWHWLVLVEAWCGDGAQLLPALAAVAEASPAITLTVLLRDENPALMDTCLTNGSRAIPKLICTNALTQERIFTWGPRPLAIKKQVEEFKKANPLATHHELNLQVHTWYAKDRGNALQQDLHQLIQQAISLPDAAPETAQNLIN
ncbi:MAG: thioredoxin family protein [Hymenobacteraceae bacterium]|nr:thioredoxin family protein [Hymenobacteraceae bacterium]MDX5397894.1 thioredoxin family protein [Hymenobacteraceae bacterium]MDX5442477.1 thioredoxin family protein [Hymenobacteraceae bacterium]MDX5513965.1 thioredoxin family protein [Hymenobacteraceae bacterium]